MKYAKLINNELIFPPKTVVLGDTTIANPNSEQLKELGYKPLIYTNSPEEFVSGKYWKSYWMETVDEIQQKWELDTIPVFESSKPLPPSPTIEQRVTILEEKVMNNA